MWEWVHSGHLVNVQFAIDLMAAAVFAITGALVASRKQMDIVGFLWLGVVTGIGGGTVRDLLILAPVFWVRDSPPSSRASQPQSRCTLPRPIFRRAIAPSSGWMRLASRWSPSPGPRKLWMLAPARLLPW